MTIETLGFIGLGVMGEPMCRNLAAKSGRAVIAHDIDAAPLERLAAAGVAAAGSVAGVAEGADLIFLSLPGRPALRAVTEGPGGLLAACPPGRTVVDTSTAPVTLTRELAQHFAAAGMDYADAPIARTRAAAEAGTLSIMVGGSAEVFARIRPFLDCCAAEVTHCGDVGSGQVVKLMNNMVLFQTVVALSEALAIGRRAGVEGPVLFETLAKGSADSFALRNHGMKAILPGAFPERAFPVDYARKDLSYALELAAEMGVETMGAEAARALLEAASEAGYGSQYFPALFNVVDE